MSHDDREKSVELKLSEVVRAFVERHGITCAETIHQSDRVMEEATGLIQDLVEVVGYAAGEEDEE